MQLFNRAPVFLSLSRGTRILIVLNLLACCLPIYAKDDRNSIKPIMDVTMLKSRMHLKKSDLQLIDVRDHAKYIAGHIPGAINLPVALTFNQRGDHTRIASLQRIRDVLSKTGIRNNNYLVLYDGGNLKNAAHEFWVLETYGHQKISVLDGGLAAWKHAHGNISRRDVHLPQSNYIPNIATHRLSTELSTLLAIKNPHVTIIDARSHDEYLGKSSRTERSGHIPGAISIPWSENLTRKSGVPRVKSRSALQSLYSALKPDTQAIAYCNRGKESAVTYLILRQMGYRVSVYDGAWLEWGNDEHVPIETGDNRSKSSDNVH